MSGAAQETLVYEEVGQPEGLLRGAILNSADPVQGFGSGVNTLTLGDAGGFRSLSSFHPAKVTVSTVATPVRQGAQLATGLRQQMAG